MRKRAATDRTTSPRIYKPRGVQATYIATNVAAALTAVAGLMVWLIAPFVAHAAMHNGPMAELGWFGFLITAGTPILLLIAIARPRRRGQALGLAAVLVIALFTIGMVNNSVARLFVVLALLGAIALAMLVSAGLVRLAMRLADDSYWLDVHRRRGACWSCGYDIRGQREPRCPECGMTIDRSS